MCAGMGHLSTQALKARLQHLHPGGAYVRIEVLHKERVFMLLAGHSETGSPVLCLAELPDTLALLRKRAFSGQLPSATEASCHG